MSTTSPDGEVISTTLLLNTAWSGTNLWKILEAHRFMTVHQITLAAASAMSGTLQVRLIPDTDNNVIEESVDTGEVLTMSGQDSARAIFAGILKGIELVQSAALDAVAITLVISSARESALVSDSGETTVTLSNARISKSITILGPTDTEDIDLFFTPVAVHVSEIRAVVRGTTPSITWTLRHHATDRTAVGTEVVTGGTTTTSETSGDDVIVFDAAAIAADSYVWLETTARSGVVESLAVTMVYTEDI